MNSDGYIYIKEPVNPAKMDGLSRDDLARLMAQRQERSSRATLVTALCILGDFDGALAIVEDPARREWIIALRESEALDDDSRCNCQRMIDTADYTRNENAKPVLKPGRKFTPEFRFWSRKYGEMTWKHVCVVCGFANALPQENLNA